MNELVFTSEIATLAAQVAPVLVVAFVVEVRALGQRRSFSKGDARVLTVLVFGSLGAVLVAAAVALLGPDVVSGWAAFWSWVFIGVPIGLLVASVCIAAWTGLTVSSMDGDEERKRQRRQDEVMARPGWRWFLLGSK